MAHMGSNEHVKNRSIASIFNLHGNANKCYYGMVKNQNRRQHTFIQGYTLNASYAVVVFLVNRDDLGVNHSSV
jgi:hypothetical protein